jgi:hypothetical protein
MWRGCAADKSVVIEHLLYLNCGALRDIKGNVYIEVLEARNFGGILNHLLASASWTITIAGIAIYKLSKCPDACAVS